MPVVQFATNSSKSQSLPVSSQRLVNCFAEKEPQDAKTAVAIFGCPGLTNFATCGAGPIRGMHVMGGVPYVVSGGTLYSFNSKGVATSLGSTVSGTKPVVMLDNGTQLLIINGSQGYIYSASGGFQLITDPNFHPSTSGCFFDNFFVLTWDGTNKAFISNSLDGTTYNGLAFFSTQVSSANLLSLVNQQESLLALTGTNIMTFYDAGTPIQPFQPLLGATVERGCGAALAVVKEDNSVFFLGDDLIFYRLDFGIPHRVSTHAAEDAWRSFTTVSDAVAFSYTHEGHKFVVLNFITANATWVYDIATGLWHERDSRDQNNRSYGRWRGNCVANAYNLTLVGDAYSGQIGFVDKTVSTEFGNNMVSSMSGPSMQQDRRRLFHSLFELDVESGIGATVNPGSNPQIMLDWSDDGGRTFSTPQIWQSMGKLGEYKHRLRWKRLGQSRDRRYRVQISDPVPRTVIAAHAYWRLGLTQAGE